MIKSICCTATLWCMLFALSTKAQVQTPRYISMIPHSNAYYEYLPQGYPEANKKYPLLLFFHGLGETVPAPMSSLLNIGPCKEINNGTFPTSFTVNGQTFKFIVITPQFTEWPTETDADNVINYLVSNYPIDINRIYLTGLSMGGGVVWNYSGNDPAHANRIAAIVPVCGAGYPYQSHAQTMAAANLPVWATHNDDDNISPPYYTIDYINYINTAPVPPTPLAKKTMFHVTVPTHDAWTKTYDPNFRENGLNIYEWMLQYQRYFTVLPVTGLEFTATINPPAKVLVTWKTVSEVNNNGFALQRGTDGISFTTIASINSKSVNGSGAEYSYTDGNPLPGSNFYRLQIKDADGHTSYSGIKNVEIKKLNAGITVYPNPATEVINITNQTGFLKRVLQIRNVNGQLVHTEQINMPGTATINISGLPKGVYYGTIIENNEKQFFKFVKK